MKSRLVLLLLVAGGLLAASAALRVRSEPARESAPRRNARSAGETATGEPASTPAPAATPDVEHLRDVFRYDEPSPATPAGPRLRPAPTPAEPPPPPGPRLVGVVRRAGRLLAALSLDGEVELALPGESAAGVLVLSVTEDSVRVRLPDGSERSLQPAD